MYSFGEAVNILHSFQDPFSAESGAKVFQAFTFSQKKTRIAEVCKTVSCLIIKLLIFSIRTLHVLILNILA